MKIAGTIIAVRHPEHHYLVNISLVKFKFKWKGKVEEREQYVVGLGTFGSDEADCEAAFALARSYGGTHIKILSVSFVGSGVAAGTVHDRIVEHFRQE